MNELQGDYCKYGMRVVYTSYAKTLQIILLYYDL